MPVVSWILCCLLMARPEGAKVLLGKQSSRYLVSPSREDLRFYGYQNNGFLQRIIPALSGFYIEVEVKNSPLSSKVKARTVAPLPKPLRSLERKLNDTSEGYLADQVGYLVEWLRDHIHLESDYNPNQSLEKVLRHGSANCVGLSSLALFVLQRMGVKARYVTGVTFLSGDRVRLLLEGKVLHRWIEIFYDDVGWVFCDPAGKINFVEATYLVLGIEDQHPLSELLENAVGTRVELLRFNNGLQTVGALPELNGRLKVRPNRLFVKP